MNKGLEYRLSTIEVPIFMWDLASSMQSHHSYESVVSHGYFSHFLHSITEYLQHGRICYKHIRHAEKLCFMSNDYFLRHDLQTHTCTLRITCTKACTYEHNMIKSATWEQILTTLHAQTYVPVDLTCFHFSLFMKR